MFQKAPIIGTFPPTLSTAPSLNPSNYPSISPTKSAAPSNGPTDSPSIPLFPIVDASFGMKSAFTGISPSDLAANFNAIRVLLEAVMAKLLGPDRSNWKPRVVRIGGIAARRSRSLVEVAKLIARRTEEDSIEVEFEISASFECREDDGCNEDAVNSAENEASEVSNAVETLFSSGQVQETLVEDSVDVGLGEVFSNVQVGEADIEVPVVTIIDPSAYPSIHTTSAPIVTPSPTSSPTYDCKDSPFRFQVEISGSGTTIARYCSWVKVNPYAKCALTGVREHCPLTCGGCQNCVDSMLRFKFEYNGVESFRLCDWVAKKDTAMRCAIKGIGSTCPLTCGTCLQSSPAPIVTPSPTSSPTYDCEDSPFRFQVKRDGKFIRRNCAWVFVKPKSRCKLNGVKSHCPQTCRSCGDCANSKLRFKFNYNGVESFRLCDWVARKDTPTRCAIEGVSTTCSLTCDTCNPTTPTAPPSSPTDCKDSPFQFQVEKNGEIVGRNCSWVGINPNERCALTGVRSHCTETCGSCEICTNSMLRFKFEFNGDNKFRSCAWVARKDTHTRCAVEGVGSTCLSTCGYCG